MLLQRKSQISCNFGERAKFAISFGKRAKFGDEAKF